MYRLNKCMRCGKIGLKSQRPEQQKQINTSGRKNIYVQWQQSIKVKRLILKHQMDNSSPKPQFHTVFKARHSSKLALPPESFLTGRGLMPPSGSAMTWSSEINNKLTPVWCAGAFTETLLLCRFSWFSCVGILLMLLFLNNERRLIRYQRGVVGVVEELVWLEGPEDEEVVGV